jgi:CHAD domain-containing protein
LLHPGWLSRADDAANDSSACSNLALHDLRKACKQVRYQAEFFAPFYGEAFQDWVNEIKTIQSQLGQLHDSQVLLDRLAEVLPKHVELPEFKAMLQQVQAESMANWETIRHQYLDPNFRQHLHQIILNPSGGVAV